MTVCVLPVAETLPTRLLVSTKLEIRQILLSSPNKNYSLPVVRQKNIQDIAVGLHRNVIYWTDPAEKKVQRGVLPDRITDTAITQPQALVANDNEEPFGIALDWYSE